MLLKIMGRMWRLRFCRLRTNNGECDAPNVKGKEIRISDTATGQEKLRLLCHEMLHAADWHKDEEWIHEVSTDLARNLTKLGFTDGEETKPD